MSGERREDSLHISQDEKRFNAGAWIILVALILLVGIFCLLSGRYNSTRLDVLKAFLHGLLNLVIRLLEWPARLIPGLNYQIPNPIPVTWEGNVETVIWSIRVPRIVAACLIGGGLALSGASYQSLFRNPLVSESILGVSAGASLGAALGILFGTGDGGVAALAFFGGIFAVFLTYMISRFLRGNQTLLLVLAGSVVSSIFSAGLSVVKYVAPVDTALP